MRQLRLPLALAVILLAAGAGLVHLPYQGFQEPVYVEIPRGASSVAIARQLAAAGVIRLPVSFLLVRGLRPKAVIQAGEYLFREPASPWEVYRRLSLGDVHYYELTVREGDNLFDIAASLDRLGVLQGEDFLAVARSPTLIRDLAPEAPTLEGYLFPAVYRLSRRTTAEELCRQMTDKFRSVWAGLNAGQPVHPVVTLASLVEKETALAEERPLVASVFRNRLRRGMPLACDPTAIYAALLEGRYRGVLYQSDLLSQNRYNTYQNPGLPPGPIANPGLASLKAALHPAETTYLYFVAKPDGSGAHTFSAALEDHAEAVLRYRRANAKNQTKSTERVPRRAAPGANR
ncbi:MAG: endolytic transglycosylase MltG [Bryobacteraceae bacterium]